MLVTPKGEVVMVSGSAADVNLAKIARQANALGAAETRRAFKVGSACVHALPITMGWMLIVVSTVAVHPGPILERLRRASAVMALALVDVDPPTSPGGGSSPSGAAPVISARRRHTS
jgi:hypothetical protein